MKRIISFIVLLCSVLMISAAVYTVPVAAAESASYDDVNASDWFYEAVQYVTDKNLFGGTGNNEFSPDVSMTRGMFVTVLGRTAENMKLTVPNTPSGFSDVESDAYYSKYVAWASDNGIVNGLGDNLFAPDSEVTREQMCKIFVEFFENFLSVDLPVVNSKIDFADSSDISEWAVGYVEKAQTAGLITGLEVDNEVVFQPQYPVTRAAAAALFMRADKLKDSILSSEGNNSSIPDSNTSGGSSTSGNSSGGNSSGNGGSSGGGGGGSSTSVDKTKTAVEYIEKIIDGYDKDSSLVASRSQATQDCLGILVNTAKDALNNYYSGGKLDKEYLNSNYSSEISEFKSAYSNLSESDKTELQSTMLNWASYSQLNYVYELFR